MHRKRLPVESPCGTTCGRRSSSTSYDHRSRHGCLAMFVPCRILSTRTEDLLTTSEWHALVGLGTNGGQPLADGDRLARGVHLLWSIRSELGIPIAGYHVWRRRHRDPRW